MKVGILTGGGDCPGLNPAIRGCVMRLADYDHQAWGIRNGWKGLVEDNIDRAPLTVAGMEELIRLGGTVLGTSRTNPETEQNGLERVRATINTHAFAAIVAIGGDDTLGAAAQLWTGGVPMVGIPKTMDNDLTGTDYTFGFDTALNTAVEALDRLRDTAKSHSRVMVLEVMGRDAGWVALYTAAAGGADEVLIPEQVTDTESAVQAMCKRLTRARERGRTYGLVIVAEGLADRIASGGGELRDEFGNVALTGRGVGEYVAKRINALTGLETRAAAIGHVQRGGAPSAFDRILATRLGLRAAECVHERDFGKMVALRGTEIITVPFGDGVVKRLVTPETYAELSPLFGQ